MTMTIRRNNNLVPAQASEGEKILYRGDQAAFALPILNPEAGSNILPEVGEYREPALG